MTHYPWGIGDVIPGTISGVTHKEIQYPDEVTSYIRHSPVIKMTQTHSANCVIVDQNTLKTSHQLPDCDACITTVPGVVLSVKTADCLPILIHHPSGLVAGIHAGRKGTENHILKNTLDTIASHTQIQDGFTLYFGPAICKSHYQIDREKNLYFDLIAENIAQLNQKIPSKNYTLIKSNICTLESQNFDSFRRDAENAGRFWTFIRSLAYVKEL
jgi:copper oxidase (laccase) domain-containing protein